MYDASAIILIYEYILKVFKIRKNMGLNNLDFPIAQNVF